MGDWKSEIKFYDSDGNVLPELFDGVAEKIATDLVGFYKNNKKPNGVSRHQLRNLFDETKRIRRQLGNKAQTWENIKPSVKLLKSKTSYAVSRAKKNAKSFDHDYYDNLKDFMHMSINKINSERDFEVFCDLFEAVYGFYYEKGGVNKE